ncbi:hypothetical protein BJ138DRAFT_1001148 [Hygrophoropsis aurantiaca]|uniref:Uncharacterized protein n=1 Tax=Hygrophoropsis aurantiaca TaxID=72124 RepID=A0ACB8ALP6_9AGAM|nr:hypothetical protein BJ138DRAFT_1001148 [Hygrophoropsis aurantiaca]
MSQPKVVIIGAGVGGLSFATSLKRKLGFVNFTIYEKASEVGGCWRANTYPGCSSDVQIHWYSLSSDLNPHWNKSHGLQPEILEYWIHLSKKYILYPHIAFNTKVISVEWSEKDQHYDIITEDVVSGQRSFDSANIVISAIGVLENPHIPRDIPGFDCFKGTYFHSARWPGGLDLRHKRVAVIGNASSGAQFVPSISEDPTVEVVNFIRTPTWFNTRPHIPYTDTQKWIFANVPFAMRLHRAWIMFQFEYPLLRPLSEDGKQKRIESFTKYLLESTPSKYHDKIIPTHPPGCKRTVANSGFLASLSRPNLTLNFDGISQITEDGIITKTGENLQFDVIIYATGFKGDTYPLPVRGLNGTTIQGYYESHGGPTGYLGTTIPDFPNYYLLAGPNTGTPTSTLFIEEVQIAYAMQLVKPVLDGLASSFSVTHAATDAYNAQLQARLSRSVHVQCYSWARTGGTGKAFNPFPWAITIWWWRLRRPIWEHYHAVGADRWVKQRRFERGFRFFKMAILVFAVLARWKLGSPSVRMVCEFLRHLIRILNCLQVSRSYHSQE